ncbi:phage tail tape measure protein [Pseudoroseicyclus sp. CXY001]|uniref:phage tail tape measure protein n=1 Tax=Pseudoroseicyclus sp. CXY001 TaxID=3242492 RepID=UPI003570E61E
MDEFEGLEPQMDELAAALGTAREMGAAFSAELGRMQEGLRLTGGEVGRLASGFSTGIRRAFDGVIFDGDRLGEALRGLGRSIADTAYDAALKPVTDGLGGLVADGVARLFGGVTASALGNGFAGGRVMPFARGGVVTAPTTFPMRGGTGLMGEAGPEAILPLARGADGRLGVRAGQGGRPVQVSIHVTTPDVAGFRRSRTQIAAEMARALERGQRNR